MNSRTGSSTPNTYVRVHLNSISTKFHRTIVLKCVQKWMLRVLNSDQPQNHKFVWTLHLFRFHFQFYLALVRLMAHGQKKKHMFWLKIPGLVATNMAGFVRWGPVHKYWNTVFPSSISNTSSHLNDWTDRLSACFKKTHTVSQNDVKNSHRNEKFMIKVSNKTT